MSRRVLITGAASGIGAAAADKLRAEGATVVGLDLNATADWIIEFDVTDQASVDRAVAEAIERLGGRVDVLINNAGLGGLGRFDRIDPARVGEMLQVNIVALTELTRLLLPGMIARGHGRIMLVGSVAGFQPGPGMAVYFASKAYVLSLGEALAHEMRGTGVTVTTLCPDATATDFFTVAGARNAVISRRRNRMMSAEDVARLGYRALVAGRRVAIAGMINRLAAFASRFAPHALTLPVTQRLMTD